MSGGRLAGQDRRVSVTREDSALDRLWRETFGAPLPMHGAGPAMKRILKDHGVNPRLIEEAVRTEPRSWI